MKNIFIISILCFVQSSIAATDYLVKVRPTSHFQKLKQISGVQRISEDVLLVENSSIKKIRQLIEIVYMEPNHKIKPLNIPNDLTSELWGIENKQYKNDANIVKAWTQTTGSKNIVVAVIDTGMDFQHPDLADNLWRNIKEVNGKAGVDGDGNGSGCFMWY